MTEPVVDFGQVVSEPEGTSEYWYVKVAKWLGAIVTAVGGPLAAAEILTVKPSTVFTGNVAPAAEKSVTTG
jgi:hypothetical protein